MHYYQFNIGDYAKHTQHLTVLEHLAYRLLLDRYYLNEEPLELDVKKLARLVGMSQYQQEVEQVLEDFFIKTKDGYLNTRCEKEIASYKAKADSARANGKKGGRPKKTQQEPKKTQSVNLANPGLTGSEANHKPLTNNHKPLTRNQEPINNSDSKRQPPVPYQKIVDVYHEHTSLPRIIKLTDKRKRLLKARWNESDKTKNLEWWVMFFQCVASTGFLNGSNNKQWSADFDWLLNENNIIKVIEGKYDERN